MKEKLIVIIHSDTGYTSRLANYINVKKAGELCAVSFAEPQEAVAYMSEHPTAVVLCEESIADSDLKRSEVSIVFLSDAGTIPIADNRISMYSSADAVIDRITAELPKTPLPFENTRLLTFFDPCGFEQHDVCLKTAKGFSREKKTLFLSFNPINSAQDLMNEDKGVTLLSDLMYAVSASGEINLEGYATQFDGFDYIGGYSFWGDADDFTSKAAGTLMEVLEQSGYERIVIELCQLHAFSPKLLDCSDKIILKDGSEGMMEEITRQLVFSGYSRLAERLKKG